MLAPGYERDKDPLCSALSPVCLCLAAAAPPRRPLWKGAGVSGSYGGLWEGGRGSSARAVEVLCYQHLPTRFTDAPFEEGSLAPSPSPLLTTPLHPGQRWGTRVGNLLRMSLFWSAHAAGEGQTPGTCCRSDSQQSGQEQNRGRSSQAGGRGEERPPASTGEAKEGRTRETRVAGNRHCTAVLRNPPESLRSDPARPGQPRNPGRPHQPLLSPR